jgi:hypothetical protein
MVGDPRRRSLEVASQLHEVRPKLHFEPGFEGLVDAAQTELLFGVVYLGD